jgi:hypothetical protein
MKKEHSIIAIFVVSLVLSTTVSAQATASATSTSTIVSPISIAQTQDMNFGNVSASSNPGTVVLTPGGSRTSTDGVSLPSATGTVTAAKFTVNGETGYSYSIGLPTTSLTLTNGGGSNAESMTVTAFTSTPTTAGTLIDGTENIFVGATLNVSASQAGGVYENEDGFDVSVNYN